MSKPKRAKFRKGQRVTLRCGSGRIYRIRGKFWDEDYHFYGTWRYKLYGRGQDMEPIEQILRPLTAKEQGR